MIFVIKRVFSNNVVEYFGEWLNVQCCGSDSGAIIGEIHTI